MHQEKTLTTYEKKLFLLLAFTNEFIPTQAMGKVMIRRKNQKNNLTASRAATQKKKLNHYFITILIGAATIVIYSYAANKNNKKPSSESGKLPFNNNNLSPDNSNDASDFEILDNTTKIEVNLEETFADNDPINIEGKFHNNIDFSTSNPKNIWEHHVAAKQCMAKKATNYEEIRNERFYRFAYQPSNKKLSEDDQKKIGKILEDRKDKPMYYHCTNKFDTFLIMLKSQFIKTAWSSSYPGAFVSTKPEIKKFGNFIIALREEAAWSSPSITASTEPGDSQKCWGGLSEPISILRFAESFYIHDDYKLTYKDLSFEDIKNEVNKIKSGLLMSLREQLNATNDETIKQQIIELETNIKKIKVKRYSELEKIMLPPEKQIAPKTWLALASENNELKYATILIISDKNGNLKYMDEWELSKDKHDLYNVKGIKLKRNPETRLLEPVTKNQSIIT